MPKVSLYNVEGKALEEMDLTDAIFGVKVSHGTLHLALVRQLANARMGTACTKTRAEVRGGGKKPWKQKGTGRARHGSSRSPIWKGGGVTFGPRPRDFSFSLPRKMRRLALRSALSLRAGQKGVSVLENLSFEKPSTKQVVKMLENLNITGKVLIIAKNMEENFVKSVRNLPEAKMISVHNLNVHDLLNYEHLLIEKEALASMEEVLV
ncbi:MAG: 50S ribosomal protein L4 [bacterium]